jgi:quinolinate synthase
MTSQINKIKKEIDAAILAHNYQLPEIQQVADYCGDSLELAKLSKKINNKIIVFCGVRFMAESAKILAPDKKVIQPVPEADCPLANMITPEALLKLKQQYPNAWVVSYVNSSAAIKALSDVCCTSSNAVTVVNKIPASEVIFVPDKNLGWWVKHNVKNKKIIVSSGFCYVHQSFSAQEVRDMRQQHPEAEILAHPECDKQVLKAADFVASTSGMLKRAKESQSREFIIGTERELLYKLRQQNPGKIFYSLGEDKVCKDMKKTTLSDLLSSLQNQAPEVNLDSEVADKARAALEGMVKWV